MNIPQSVLEMIQRIQPHCCGTKAAPIHTAEMCFDLFERKVPGCLIECGVAAGAQLGVLRACAAVEEGPLATRSVHGFDNFLGTPRAGPEDANDIAALVGRGDYRESSRISGCPFETVSRLFREWGAQDVELWVGWFDDTLPKFVEQSVSIGLKIALLRLDANLYASTKVCVDHLFPLLSPGAIVIVDDNAVGVWKAVREKFSEFEIDPVIVQVPNTSGSPGGIGIQWFRFLK